MAIACKANARFRVRAANCLLITTASGALLAAESALAQQAPTQTPSPTSAPNDIAPPDIVVTAQKREESLQKVPISIAVLSGTALDKQESGGSLAALTEVPGIAAATADTGGMTQISMRGVAPAGFFASGTATVAYYLDGVPFQFVRNAIVPNAKAYDMSRIEVLRGPQGTLYGASALNGVVRILTNDANVSHFEFKARGGVSFTEGGDPSFRTDAAINIPLVEDKLSIRVVGGVERLGGWIDQPVRGKNNANSSQSDTIRVKLAWKPTDNLRIDLGAWLDRSHYDAADYANGFGVQNTPLAQPGTTEFDIYSGKVAYDLPFATITSSTSYIDFRQRMYADASFNNPGYRPFLQSYFSLPAHVFSEELVANSTHGGPWRWSVGAFYRNAEDDRYQDSGPLLPGIVYWRDFSESYAIFGQVTRAFADDRLELTGGLRYFGQKGRTETPSIAQGFLPVGTVYVPSQTKVTPRVVLTWLPSATFTAYASYAQGFRAGLNQMPLALRVAPNLQNVKADTLNNYEVGAKGTLLNGLIAFDLAGYYMKWVDAQLAVGINYLPPPSTAVVASLINGPSASGFGTDLGVTLRPGAGIQIGANLSYNDLHWDGIVSNAGTVLYAKGDRLAFSPKLSGSAYASYSFPLAESLKGVLKVSVDYRASMVMNAAGLGFANSSSAQTGIYCSPYGSNSTCKSDSTTFLSANFDLVSDSGKTLTIYGTNLTNSNALLEPSAAQTTPFRPRPRTIGVQFEVKF